MSVEKNKEVVHCLLQEVVNQRNLTLVDEIVVGNCVFHASDGQEVNGTDVVKQMLTTFFDAFGDFHVTIKDVVGEGDKVAVRFFESGRHEGEFEGISPTGKDVMWLEMAVFRVVNGKIVEVWTLEDRLSLMRQLGAISLPD